MGIFDKTASTKRATLTGGLRGDPTTYLTDLSISSLDPVTAELAMRIGTKAPEELLQTFIEGVHDVREGDYLTVNGRDYPIRSCAEWDWDTDNLFMQVVLEDIKA